MKKLLLVFSCFLVFACAGTAMADTLKLPAGLKEIGVEAFCGDTSLDAVIIQEGTTAIRSRAFADSAIASVSLPDSLTFIAEDAFANCAGVHATVNYGTYAYQYAQAHGFLSDDLSISGNTIYRLSALASTYSLSVNSDLEWTARTENGWLTPTIQNKTTLQIKLSQNTTGADRAGTVVVTNGVTSKTITVFQSMISQAPTVEGLSSSASAPTVLAYTTYTMNVNRVYEGMNLFFELYTVNADGSETYNTRRYYTNAAYAKLSIVPVTDFCNMVPGGTYRISVFELPEDARPYSKYRVHINSYYIRYENSVPVGGPYAPVQSAPSGLVKQVKVSWGTVNNAASYNVYYNTTNSISSAKEITGITDLTYTIAGLKAGTTYYTWVKAVNDKGTSGASNAKSTVTKPDAPVQNTPAVSGQNVTLSWNEVTGATSYRVHYGKTSDYSASEIIQGVTATSYMLKNLDADTTYYFWVAAVNSSGSQWKTAPQSATTTH